MSKCFIEGVGGGGSGKIFAAIGVDYPEGAILTCTDGLKLFHAKTTTGNWVFSIPYVGTWTVTCTDATGYYDPVSEVIEITKEGQSASVELSYNLLICRHGVWNTDLAGSLVRIGAGGASGDAGGTRRAPDVTQYSAYLQVHEPGSTYYYTGTAYSSEKIDFTNYKTLHIRCAVTAPGNTNYQPQVSLWWSTPGDVWGSNRSASITVGSKGASIGATDYTISLDGLNGSYHFGCSMVSTNSSSAVIQFYEVYATKT